MRKLSLIFSNPADINKKEAVMNSGGRPLIVFTGLSLKNPLSRHETSGLLTK